MGAVRRSVAVALSALAACALPCAARAELWAYVDAQGRTHLADRRADDRYTLFYKGPTTLDVARGAAEERAQAIAALAGTPLFARATDPALLRRYAPLIDANARANDLDPALLRAVVAAESGFDPRAVSDRGAIGLMQVLPATAERYGLSSDRARSVADQLLEPARNVQIGARYLRDLLARFDGDLALALAAYNAGEGAVASHGNALPPFAETRDYVTRVRQLYAIYRPSPAPARGRIRLLGHR